jgi:CheY-like chemotaxis protein
VLVSVADDGIGLSSELLPKVFELFTQAERTPDRAQGGLGIGLALVKSLTELHGGKATISSDGVNQGCKLVICLPRLEEPVGNTHKPRPDTWQQLPRKVLRVMIVDDNEDAAQTLALLIQTPGHIVVVEHGAEAALKKSKDEAPDICILDIGLPEMDGYELARHLRAQQETANSVLIAVTGYGQEEDRKRALASGFDYHLVKPVDTRKLAGILAKVDSA